MRKIHSAYYVAFYMGVFSRPPGLGWTSIIQVIYGMSANYKVDVSHSSNFGAIYLCSKAMDSQCQVWGTYIAQVAAHHLA